jgi:leucyl-tRNA synthetase
MSCGSSWATGGADRRAGRKADPAALVRDQVEIVVQVNGKLRGRDQRGADAAEEVVKAAALADENVRKFIAGAGAEAR